MKRGFTVIELIVVIVVIVILAGIAMMGYMGWREDSIKTVVKADLKTVASTLEQHRNFHDSYPSALPVTSRTETEITLTIIDGGDNFCLYGESKDYPSIHFWLRSDEGFIRDTAC